jgi:hypothetical protein
MKYLKVGDILYKVVYDPEIYLEIYYVGFIRKSNCDNTSFVELRSIIGNSRNHWLENTANFNKLIKHKHYSHIPWSEGYFLTLNEKLAVKKLKTLIQYAPKTKE